MQDILELERRITAAIERITYGVERLSGAAVPAGASGPALSGEGEAAARIAHLTEALDEERMTNAQLNERLRVLREKTGRHFRPLHMEAGRVPWEQEALGRPRSVWPFYGNGSV